VVPVWSSEHDDPLEPPPLESRPAPGPINRRTGRPHCGQVFKGLADMLWNLSKRWPQLPHSYSYVGMVHSLSFAFEPLL